MDGLRSVGMDDGRMKALIGDNRVGVVGLGLIGGSIALDLRALGVPVQGLVHRASTAERAMERGLVDAVSCDPACLQDCDLVVLALPLEALLNPQEELVKALPEAAAVTDVGSVKGAVLDVWRDRHPRFVASHPMAGTAESGVESGCAGLFRRRPWVGTPEAGTDMDAVQKVQQLAEALGAHWIHADPLIHDQAVGLISHLPVMVSAALLRAVGEERDPRVRELAKQLASSGFADTTRVGGGNPALGTAMASRNTASLMRALAAYRWSLEQLEEAILNGHWAQLEQELQNTRALRPEFLAGPPGSTSASG